MTQRNPRRTGRFFAAALLFLIALPALADGPFRFYALTPCRAVDTRTGFGGQLQPTNFGNPVRTFSIQGVCGVPPEATAVALNVTVVTPTAKGHLRLFPSGTATPNIASINFAGGETALANGAIVPLADNAPDLSVYTFLVSGAGNSHLVLDVTGYFAPAP